MTAPAEHTVWIEGLAFWSPTLPGWAMAAPALRGEPSMKTTLTLTTTTTAPAAAAAAAAAAPARRPAGALLAANERRRAPDSVLLALEVAHAAVTASGRAAETLASVFTSAYGDLAIVDALCRTLASDPLLLSPLRFHHSVHNAASGYWAIGSGSRRASTALAGGAHSFAAGLLEAASACVAEQRPTLLVGFDTEAIGPLASVNRSRGLLGVALVLAPEPGPAARWRVGWSLQAGAAPCAALPSAAARALAANAQADALPLFEALARGAPGALALALGDTLHIALRLQPLLQPVLQPRLHPTPGAAGA